MKTLLIKLSSSFFLILLSFHAFSRPVAQVGKISGNAFVISAQGVTTHLAPNEHLEENSEILVGEDGLMALNDYFDTTYHLAPGTHLKFFNKSVQLKNGKIWIKSTSSKNLLSLTTANGQADFNKGEFIVTFDQLTNRSQFLVINGEIDVSNILNKEIKFLIPGGSFTFIDPEIDTGIPRNPTRVGVQSLQAAMDDFKKFPEKAVESKVIERKIASVTEKKELPEPSTNRGKIIYLSTNRQIASVASGEAHQYFNKVTKKTEKMKRSHTVQVNIYGSSWLKNLPVKEVKRVPASIKVVSPEVSRNQSPAMSPKFFLNDAEFESSLNKHQAEQPKYPKELNSLIEELKSF